MSHIIFVAPLLWCYLATSVVVPNRVVVWAANKLKATKGLVGIALNSLVR